MIAKVYDRSIFISENEAIVARSVDEYIVHFEYSEAWDDYAKTAVFKNTAGTLKEVIIANDAATIPWEVITEPGHIVIGVYGIDGTKFRPTVWSEPQTVYDGAEEGDPVIQPQTTPWQGAVEQIASDLADAEAAANRAEAAAEVAEGLSHISAQATTLQPGSSATASYNQNTHVLSLGIPEGSKGTDGFAPTVSVSKQGKITTVTITDKNGDHTATILDGEDGSGTGDMTKAVYDTNNDGIVNQADLATNASKLGGNLPSYYAKASDIPSKTSDLTNDSGFITSASVPTKTSDLTNDSGFITKTGVVKSVNGETPNANGAVTVPVDATPTVNSTNPVQSGGVASIVSDLTTRLTAAESDLAMLTTKQSGEGTFNATADTYIMSENRTFLTYRRGFMLTVYMAFKLLGSQTTSNFTEIGNLPSNHLPNTTYTNLIPVQGVDKGMVSVMISYTGAVSLYRPSNVNDGSFVRTVFTVPLANSVL